MNPDNAYVLALIWAALAFFLLGAGLALTFSWAMAGLYRRRSKKWRDEVVKLRAALRHERLARRSPVQQFNDRRADPRPLAYDPPVTRRYNDHPPMRPVPIVRSADDTQVIGRIDQTGDVT